MGRRRAELFPMPMGHSPVYVPEEADWARPPGPASSVASLFFLRGTGWEPAPAPLPPKHKYTHRSTHRWRGRKPPCHMADKQLQSNLFLLVTANRSRSPLIWWAELFDGDKFDICHSGNNRRLCGESFTLICRLPSQLVGRQGRKITEESVFHLLSTFPMSLK